MSYLEYHIWFNEHEQHHRRLRYLEEEFRHMANELQDLKDAVARVAKDVADAASRLSKPGIDPAEVEAQAKALNDAAAVLEATAASVPTALVSNVTIAVPAS